jgi:membrane protease YdiL (CAAX protease family)
VKDAARLAAYFAATILVGALLAPPLFWVSHYSLAAHGLFPFLAKYNFETFFHRALLIAAALLLWPFLSISGVRSMADLGLLPNPRWTRDVLAGVLLSAIPLLCCGALLIALKIYSFRHNFLLAPLGKTLAASVTVPFIEETFFRGIVLGILLRSGWRYMSIFATSAVFSVVHFLKAPSQTSIIVTWTSGFNSIAHSFQQFGDVTMVAAAFTTLFLIGWILADARWLTHSLWLPIGLHAGWIFGSGTFSRVARQQMLVLPWLGKNLLVGIVPLGVAGFTWLIMRTWVKYDRARQV